MSRREQIESLNAELTKVIAAKDHEGLAALYAEDAKLLPPTSPIVEGREAIGSRFEEFLKTVNTVDFSFELVDVIEAGDIVIDISKMKVAVELKNGNKIGHDAKHLLVWKEQADGSLKILVEVLNRDSAEGGRR